MCNAFFSISKRCRQFSLLYAEPISFRPSSLFDLVDKLTFILSLFFFGRVDAFKLTYFDNLSCEAIHKRPTTLQKWWINIIFRIRWNPVHVGCIQTHIKLERWLPSYQVHHAAKIVLCACNLYSKFWMCVFWSFYSKSFS